MAHPRWQAGNLSTGFIAEEFPDGFASPAPDGVAARIIAAVAAAVDHVLGERKRRISGQMGGRAVVRERLRSVWLGGSEIRLMVAREPRGVGVRFVEESGEGPVALLASPWKPGEPVWQGTIDGDPVAVQVRPILNGFLMFHRGVEVKAFVYTASEAEAARLMPIKVAADAGKKLLCPMPGLVVAIAVTPGQEVKAGETLAIVEAMKMENVLRAERDGTVKAVFAKKGDSLAVDAVILEFA
jgi:propionyl-CoA carboxylase alpha chain